MSGRDKALAPGTVVFHPHRGYGVLTTVNLMTGWVSARFGDEHRALDLCLASDSLQHADGQPILFRRSAPDYMPHARLMAMVRYLHEAGYERLYLYTWPKPSGMHWRWHLFCGQRDWVHRPLRPSWYGSGSDYIFNPVMGWGDAPGASAAELAEALAQFDPQGLAHARGRDPEHSAWFSEICRTLLPHYAYSLGWDTMQSKRRGMPENLPIMAVRRGMTPYTGPALDWPPGWIDGWAHHGYHRALRRAAQG
ncbi:MAG: L-asparaginase [Burkholderiaceae bacterium]|jgi:hypothetical protein